MELRKLLKNIKPVAIKGNEDIDVTGVNINSRLIGKGNLFIQCHHRRLPEGTGSCKASGSA